jgi:signal transduction histidine kinase
MSDSTFRPRARLLLQLGDQLIKNESIALLELVKNSYDAEAKNVEIWMRNLDRPVERGEITIQDDGHGMSLSIVKNVWLEPGSDYKAKLLAKLTKSKRKTQRLPLGEKGIGRFSVHKLGEVVEMITRMSGKKEVVFRIDWNSFKKVKYIGQVPIRISERKPVVFKNASTGTLIRIQKLRKGQWSPETLKEVFRSVNAMCSPFDTPDAFKVTLKTDNPNDFKDLPTYQQIKEAALYRFRCELVGNMIEKFSYTFQPYPAMKDLSPRTVTEKSDGFSKVQAMVGPPVKLPDSDHKESPPINISSNGMKIGRIVFEGLIFDRETQILKLGHILGKHVKDYLNLNGGVRVYRDGVRVYDYGEPENDWLGLEQRRLYKPGLKINSKLILAAAHLDRRESSDLIEKTNREGFIDNEAYKTLVAAVTYALEVVEEYRHEDKEKVREFYGLSPKSEPLLANIAELKNVVETRVKDSIVQKECLKYLDRIENDYREIHEILLTSAEAGLNLGVAIHEIEKIILELKRVVTQERTPQKVVRLIRHLAELIEMYGNLLRRSKQKHEQLKTLIDDALFHTEYRLKAHQIEVIKDFVNFTGDSTVNCSGRLVIGSILNIIDNSIYWLERAKVKHKKIYVSLKKQTPHHLKILIADNGRGFAMPATQMVKPFVSLKPGGMGLGLHIVSEVMSAQGGSIVFPKHTETDLPADFSEGAIIGLSFKKDVQP